MSDEEEVVLNIIEDPEELAKYQAEHEMPEEERVRLTAEMVERENQEAEQEGE
jgi:hypothetical protein